MIIGISGKAQHGKNLVGDIIQYLCYLDKIPPEGRTNITLHNFIMNTKVQPLLVKELKWEQKSFAYKLKQIVALLIGCTVEQLENSTFKETSLGQQWQVYKIWSPRIQQFLKDVSLNQSELEYLITTEYRTIENELEIKLVDTTPRLLMQLIGTECGREILHPNIWINALMLDYRPEIGYRRREGQASKTVDGKYIVGNDLSIPKKYHNKIITSPIFCWYEDSISTYYPDWLITDVRFRNEAQAIKDQGGILIRVNRPGTIRCNRCYWVGDKADLRAFISGDEQHDGCPRCKTDDYLVNIVTSNHLSETALDNYRDFDFFIENDDTEEELVQKVRFILNKLGLIINL